MATIYKIKFSQGDRNLEKQTKKEYEDDLLAQIKGQVLNDEVAKQAYEQAVKSKPFMTANQQEREFIKILFKDALRRSKDPIAEFRKLAVWADEMEKTITEAKYDNEQLDVLRSSFKARVKDLNKNAVSLFFYKDIVLQLEKPEEIKV